jgi:hypothetical protein
LLEEIVRILKEEKTSRDLVELPDDFYQRTAGYISQLNSELERGDSLKQKLLREELRNVVLMLQEIHQTRVQKAARKTVMGQIPVQLMERERYAFSEVRQSLERLQADLVSPAVSGRATVPIPSSLTNTLLVMLMDVPDKIIGADMRGYGPFVRGEIVSIPAQNAEIMIRHGVARKIALRP